MLNQLQLINLPSDSSLEGIPLDYVFVLKTCQRTLLLLNKKNDQGFNFNNQTLLAGPNAYQFLLETICGLHSKLIAENEIVSQFKQAYKEYLAQEKKDHVIVRVLEKLFKDAKEIRSEYLLGLSQKTYSAIIRKNLINKYHAESVLIIGSGNMAIDLINQLSKKVKIYITARNAEKLNQIASQYNVEIVDWHSPENYLQFSHVVNTIGTEKVIFDHDFFNAWEKSHRRSNKLFVDTGSPSSIKTEMTLSEGLMRLDDIFNEGAIHETYKQKKIEIAKKELKKLVLHRHNSLQVQVHSTPL